MRRNEWNHGSRPRCRSSWSLVNSHDRRRRNNGSRLHVRSYRGDYWVYRLYWMFNWMLERWNYRLKVWFRCRWHDPWANRWLWKPGSRRNKSLANSEMLRFGHWHLWHESWMTVPFYLAYFGVLYCALRTST